MSIRHRIALIGGGKRGIGLARYFAADTGRATLVAVAEPRQDRREESMKELDLPPEAVYRDHRELLDRCSDLDAVIVATDPPTHRDVACACMQRQLAIFLEKPMADTIENARAIASLAQRSDSLVQIGFNLRYAPFYEKLHELVSGGALGKVLSINWTEAPSVRMWIDDYCRCPSYNRRAAIGSWILEKSCHDIDVFNWLLGATCVRVSSFGNRSYFVPRDDVPQHCTEGCPVSGDCLYYSERQEVRGRLQPGESDICVYNCGSDLFDRQSTIFEYDDGTVVSFNLLPVDGGRFMHIAGTEATLYGRDAVNEIVVSSIRTGRETTYRPEAPQEGHGGADVRMPAAFFDYLDDPRQSPRTTVEEGLEAVIMCCAADLSASELRVIELDSLRRNG